jgi:ABC-2 type transport system permease protein
MQRLKNKQKSMKKISIIIQREYLSRVKKRSFIITTLGLPLLMVGFSVLIGFIGAKSKSTMQYAVVDESKIFENQLTDSVDKSANFSYFPKQALDSLRINYEAKKFDALLHITTPAANGTFEKQNIKVYSSTNVSSDAATYLEQRINTVFQNKIMTDAGMNRADIDSINNISLSFSNITKDATQANAKIAILVVF